MTLDFNFGKDVAVIEDYIYIEGEDLTAEPKPENKLTYEFLVEMEPETFDVCNPKWTDNPKSAFRSCPCGSRIDVFLIRNIPGIHEAVEKDKRNIVPVSSIIDKINNLNPVAPASEGCPELYEDRVKWFQYWANKCIRLYGDEAKFSVS